MLTAEKKLILPSRWTKLRYHTEQHRLAFKSKARFKIVPAGRQSGKTEYARRIGVINAMTMVKPRGRVAFMAPTRDQAKVLYWEDLKLLIPKWYVTHVNESKLTITLKNGCRVMVIGLDKSERAEGVYYDHVVIDEIADCKPDVWGKSIRPALSTRSGTAWLIGVPEGRNHYYEKYLYALENRDKGWDVFTWFSADIMPPEEIEAARHELDRLTFMQEYEAQFVDFMGRAYHAFCDEHIEGRALFDPNVPEIAFCFDFNVDPGTALVVQEAKPPSWLRQKSAKNDETCTNVIDEVFIERNSNTVKVCRELASRWDWFEGDVLIYGDPSGGQRRTSALSGSDWDLVQNVLAPVFGNRLKMRVDRKAPPERTRLNAMNSRLESADGTRRVAVDRQRCRNTIRDFEGVTLGDNGEIKKTAGTKLTHLSDALGYYVARRWPVRPRTVTVKSL